MKENKMAEAISNVNEKYVEEAASYKPKKKKLNPAIMSFAAMAACLVLVLGIGMLRNKDKDGSAGSADAVVVTDSVDSVVSIDINPSIELLVDKNNKVLSAVALNADAQIVLAGMDLKKVDLSTAMNAIMGSLLKNGYLDEVYNAINVCVENDNEERATELGELVTGEISSIFDENDLIGGINTQYCTSNDETKKLADSYGISVGKLLLAQKVSANMGMSLDVAVKLSVSELWDLLDAESATLISKEEALEIAVKDAQVENADLTYTSVKIQESNGVFTYVIKFTVGETKEYSYKVNAIDGSVISSEFKIVVKVEPTPVPTATPIPTATPAPTATPVPTVTPAVTPGAITTVTPAPTATPVPTATPAPTATPTPEPVKEISKIEALAIAYNDAALGTTDVKLTKLEYSSIEKEYQIEFSVGLLDYIYVICSADGSIIRKAVVDNTVTEDTEDPNSVLSIDEALELVLAKVGVELDDLTLCDIKYTNNNKGAEYKVHFHVDKDHYEYIVNAATGEITEKAKPVPPHEQDPKPTPVPPVPPHEKDPKPAGPEDSKITIDFEDAVIPTTTPTVAPTVAPTATPTPTTKPEPLKPHEKAEAEKPVPPHEKEKPVPPHEKEAAAKPAGPKEKAEAAKPVGPKEAKVTVTFEKAAK